MLDLELLKNEALNAIKEADSKALEELRIEYLSKKGKVQSLMAQMKDLPAAENPKFGQLVNDLKNSISEAIENKKNELEANSLNEKLNFNIVCKGSGILYIKVRSRDVKDNNGNRCTIDARLLKLLVNGKGIVNIPRTINYDNYHEIQQEIKNNEELTCHIEWKSLY